MKDQLGKNSEELYCQTCFIEMETDAESGVDTENVPETIHRFCKKRGLKIFHQNINGLLNKIEKVRLFLSGTHRNVHVYGISESHTTPNIRDEELEIDGYDLVRKDRENGEYGGVLCFIRSDIKYQRRRDLEIAGLAAIWIEIFVVRSRSILVCFLTSLRIVRIISTKTLRQNFET